MIRARTFLVAVLAVSAGWCPEIGASGRSQERVDFARDVRPLFEARCFGCHGPERQRGKLRLDRRPPMPGVVDAGDARASALFQRVTSADPEERMPAEGEALGAAEIELLRRWIEEGASWPAEGTEHAYGASHWAYVRLSRPEVPPDPFEHWARNPLDCFVARSLREQGLAPSAEADRSTLIRRASLDLTGLPPTPEEVDRFASDDSPRAYEELLERLLASPHYGEHQARAWLDLARYADSDGYEKDDRRSVWRWRDWVIEAFDRDLSFERFTLEQLAGDLLPDADSETVLATGFHRNTMTNKEGGTDPEEFRVAAVKDRVDTTATVWLGTTLACAQCHDHKYDPLTQAEYYRFYAFFDGTEDVGNSNAPEVPASRPSDRSRDEALRAEKAALEGALAAPGEELARLAEIERELAAMPTALVLRERPEPRATHVMLKGNFLAPGAEVQPGTPAVLPPLAPRDPSRRADRLDLARWLVAPANPLTARVFVNRLWERLFGRGLVATSQDFGSQGERPSHPELLDWLALQFVERGWSVKELQQLILSSATYRQSARVTPELLARDAENRWLARGPRLRADAETVRDIALAASGLLCAEIGGPSVFPPQPDGIWMMTYSDDRWVTSEGCDRYRRGLYTFLRRTAPYPTLLTFDGTSREVVCPRRSRTNTPLQALATLNDPAFVECALALAARMMEAGQSPEARVVRGFRLCVARTPQPEELVVLLELYRAERSAYAGRPADAEALAGTMARERGLDPLELAAWTVVANALLNLDETITKG